MAAPRRTPVTDLNFELEALEGILGLAVAELAELGFPAARVLDGTSARFTQRGNLRAAAGQLGRARLATAFHLVLDFPVPRPKALLGDQHLRRLLDGIRGVQAAGGHDSFRISAAGSDSSVFQRLAAEIASRSGLRHDPEEGTLLLRVRPGGKGWQVLLRLTPRPLSTRSWRVCNLEGGLNATIAAAMNQLLSQGRPAGTYLNAMCGSGTLLAEWLTANPQASGSGFDLSSESLGCARDNLSGFGERAQLFQADATAVPLPDASIDFISCDPPWGDDIGTHDGNAVLYPAFLAEATRLLRPGGRLALLSHELKLTRGLLKQAAGLELLGELRVWHGGHRPAIWILQRR